jgi:hypothetical protein
MTTKQKFSLASHDTFDPVSLIGVGLAAGIEQANNTYAGDGQVLRATANVLPQSLAMDAPVTS